MPPIHPGSVAELKRYLLSNFLPVMAASPKLNNSPGKTALQISGYLSTIITFNIVRLEEKKNFIVIPVLTQAVINSSADLLGPWNIYNLLRICQPSFSSKYIIIAYIRVIHILSCAEVIIMTAVCLVIYSLHTFFCKFDFDSRHQTNK